MNNREKNGFDFIYNFVVEHQTGKYRFVYVDRLLRCTLTAIKQVDNGLTCDALGYENYRELQWFNLYKKEDFYLSYHDLPNELYYEETKIFDLNDYYDQYMQVLPKFADFEKIILIKDIYDFKSSLQGQIIYKLDELNYLVKFKNTTDFYKIPAWYLDSLNQ